MDSPGVSRSSLAPGQSFTLTATVRNRGDVSSASTTLRYYRSSGSDISSSDTAEGTDSVGTLGAGATSAESVVLTAPVGDGTYYYGACVDSVAGESVVGNNCSTGLQVTVVPKRDGPDLVLRNSGITLNEREPGEFFIYGASVANVGNGGAPATTARFYASSDAEISTSDTQLGTEAVRELTPDLDDFVSIGLNAPQDWGVYYYGACVDAVFAETDTNNNCSSAARLVVGAGEDAPDLVVESANVDNGSPTVDQTFTFSATVRNRGDVAGSSTTVRYYRATTGPIYRPPNHVGSGSVGRLAASAISGVSISLTESSAGTYYYGACVDAVPGELRTRNNCSSAVRVTVASGN